MAERLLILLRTALLHTRFSLSLSLSLSVSPISLLHSPFFPSSIPNHLFLFVCFFLSFFLSFVFLLFLPLSEPKHRQTRCLVLPPLVSLCLVFDTFSNDHNLSLLLHYFLRLPPTVQISQLSSQCRQHWNTCSTFVLPHCIHYLTSPNNPSFLPFSLPF